MHEVAHGALAAAAAMPLVIIRKISGGSRSEDGSRVRTALASLFATWQAQGREPFQACCDLLRHATPAL